jgi:hypothetical protein
MLHMFFTEWPALRLNFSAAATSLPVLSLHGAAGCRRSPDCRPKLLEASLLAWLATMGALDVSPTDKAWRISRTRPAKLIALATNCDAVV